MYNKNDLSKMNMMAQQQMQQQSQQAMMMGQPGPMIQSGVMGQQMGQQMNPHMQNQMSQEQMQMNQQMHMQQNMMHQHQMQQQQQSMQPQQQTMQQQQAVQQQHTSHQQMQQDQKNDNISKVKTLSSQLNDALMDTLRMGGMNLHSSAQIETGVKFGGEMSSAKFEECMEKFYSICDQMELHLKTAIDHQYQSSASQRYTPAFVSTNPPPDVHKYSHYVNTVRQQVSYAKDVHNNLLDATSGMSNPLVPPVRPLPHPHDSIASMDTQS